MTQNRKTKKRRYYGDIYSDDGVESDNEFSENDDESSDEEIVKSNKKTQARKETLARTTVKTMVTEPASLSSICICCIYHIVII